jgi:hypothetical protein
MKLPLIPILLTLSISTILFSCRKTHETTIPPPGKTVDSTHASFIYMATVFQQKESSFTQFELIVTTSDSEKILLDTIAAVNTNINATLATAGTVDLTVIYYVPPNHSYYATTSRGVNPAAWSVLTGSDSLIGQPTTTSTPPLFTSATITYANSPAPAGQSQPYTWSDHGSNFQTGVYYNYPNNPLPIPYAFQANDDAYFCYPNLALYNLHHIQSTADIVDLSTMDTAVRVSYNFPAQYSQVEAFLVGYADTSDLTSQMYISELVPGYDTIIGAHMIYPGKGVFQKYDDNVGVYTKDFSSSSTFNENWRDTVNTNPVFLDDSYFTLSSTQNNNFTVRFNNTTPGYYSTFWLAGGSLSWSLSTSGDSTTLHPLTYLVSLKSKMLAAQNLNAITLSGFSVMYNVNQNQLGPVGMTPPTNVYQPPFKPASGASVTYNKNFY